MSRVLAKTVSHAVAEVSEVDEFGTYRNRKEER
jgi:hypothetical protein